MYALGKPDNDHSQFFTLLNRKIRQQIYEYAYSGGAFALTYKASGGPEEVATTLHLRILSLESTLSSMQLKNRGLVPYDIWHRVGVNWLFLKEALPIFLRVTTFNLESTLCLKCLAEDYPVIREKMTSVSVGHLRGDLSLSPSVAEIINNCPRLTNVTIRINCATPAVVKSAIKSLPYGRIEGGGVVKQSPPIGSLPGSYDINYIQCLAGELRLLRGLKSFCFKVEHSKAEDESYFVGFFEWLAEEIRPFVLVGRYDSAVI